MSSADFEWGCLAIGVDYNIFWNQYVPQFLDQTIEQIGIYDFINL